MIQIEMEMPDKCSECRFRTDYDFCSAMPKNFCGNTLDEGKPDWCPLKNADGWISVKDRMPEVGDTVLFTGMSSFGTRFSTQRGWFDGTFWKRDAGETVYSSTPVTHWMPLPEPPQEESND